MSYIQDNLMPNEKILLSARVHPAVFLPSVGMFIVSIVWVIFSLTTMGPTSGPSQEVTAIMNGFILMLACFFFLLIIGTTLKALIIMSTTEFAVTNRKIIAKTGLIRRRTIEMLLPKVESIAVNQNILGRILNFGNVTVVGTGGTKETFQSIKDPITVRNKINQIIEDYTQAFAEYQQQKALSPK